MRALAACAVVLLLAGTRIASAEDKVLVLRAEGRADKKIRVKVEAAVLKMSKASGEATTAGDVTYGDAAAMIGCKPEDDKCKDEVLGMLSVEEIVTITTTPKPGGIEVLVRRIGKGGVTKTATVIVAPEKADQLDAIGPLFGKEGPPSALPPPVTSVSTPTPPPVREPVREPVRPAPTPLPPASTIPPPETAASTTTTPPPRVADATPIGPAEEPRDDRPRGNRRLAMIGMAGGGALLLIGVVFWASASNIEDEIADAPKRTKDDLRKVQDLEDEGDTYATAGNFLALTGLVIGGVSTYFFLRSGRHRAARSAHVTPMFGHGGTGAVVTWGGSL